MGLATSQIRLIYLTMLRSDLEFKIQLITQSKISLTNSTSELIDAGNNLDPSSPEMKLLAQRQQRLQAIEKKLDATIERYKTMLNAVTTELQAAERFVSEDIRLSFNYSRG